MQIKFKCWKDDPVRDPRGTAQGTLHPIPGGDSNGQGDQLPDNGGNMAVVGGGPGKGKTGMYRNVGGYARLDAGTVSHLKGTTHTIHRD